MKNMKDIINGRRETILDWLSNCNFLCRVEQKHLDEGTAEQAYWNHGYATAMKDVLAIMDNGSETKH